LPSLVAVALLCTRVTVAADPPPDDPLPPGATLRLGSDRLAYRYPPYAALLPPDYRTFVVPDRPLGFRRIDAATGKSLDGESGGASPGPHVVTSGDGRRAVVVQTGILTVRAVETGKAVRELKPPAGFGTFLTTTGPHLSLSGDGTVAAQGVTNNTDGTGTVLVWDVDRGEVVARFDGLAKMGALPVLSVDGKLVATRPANGPFVPPGAKDDGAGRTVRVWDVGAGKELFTARLSFGGFQIPACAFSPDGTLLAASCGEGTIDVWEVKGGKLRATLLGRTGQGYRVAFAPDGKTLASVSSDGVVQRWATADGKPLGATDPPTPLAVGAVRGLAFATDERVVVWSALGSTAAAWEVPSGKFLRPPGEHTAAVKGVGFADGGKRLVTAGADGRVVRWDVATGKPVGSTALRVGRGGGPQPQLPVSLAPDAARVLVLGNPAAVYDPTTGEELFALPSGAAFGVSAYTIPSADGTRAVTLTVPHDPTKTPTGTATVWDLVGRKRAAAVEFAVAGSGPAAAALSPSGDRLVVARTARAADADRVVLVVSGFDLKTGKKLGDYEDHTGGAVASVTAASETTAVVAFATGRVRLVDFVDGRGGDEVEKGGRREPGAGPLVFSPDGKRFAVGVETDRPDVFGVRVYAWPSARPVHTFTGHRTPVTALAFSPDGKALAAGAHDTTVLLWDLTAIDKPK
jgi:WD40 repeat protein